MNLMDTFEAYLANKVWFMADNSFSEKYWHFFINILVQSVIIFMAEEFNFRCVTYEHSLRMFCIQCMIYGGEACFIRSYTCTKIFRKYRHILRMFCIQSIIYGWGVCEY